MDIALSLAYYCSATFVSVQILILTLDSSYREVSERFLDPDKGRPRFYFLTILLIRHTDIL